MFNPNEPGIKNGNIFGFPVSFEESDLVIIPVCSDITCSYRKGTAYAPKLILEESTQLDFYSPYLEKAWEQKVFMLPINDQLFVLNKKMGGQASQLIQKQEKGVELSEDDRFNNKEINVFCAQQTNNVALLSKELLTNNKTPLVLGGDHSSPLGLLQSLAEEHEDFGILHLDAHADLREAYESFDTSHASIMFNALKSDQISKLVQVGVRDICDEEITRINNSKGRVKTFFDWDLKSAQFEGTTWQKQCEEIVHELPDKVYISFDIDGLTPDLCPTTGTPVPGGMSFEQASYLLNLVAEKKQLIGADLCEVGHTQWDAIVGARVLYLLTTLISKSKKRLS